MSYSQIELIGGRYDGAIIEVPLEISDTIKVTENQNGVFVFKGSTCLVPPYEVYKVSFFKSKYKHVQHIPAL